MDDHQAMTAIFYVLRTGYRWKALQRHLGASSTVHDRSQQGQAAGVFARLWQGRLLTYDELQGLEWEWQALDGAMTKASSGEEGTGPNPTDHGTQGIKRRLLTGGHRIRPAVPVDGANRHDIKLEDGATLRALAIERPEPTAVNPQHLCPDKGYHNDEVGELAAGEVTMPSQDGAS